MLIRKLAQGAVLWVLGVLVFSGRGMANGYESFAFQNSYAASVPVNVSYAGVPSDFVPVRHGSCDRAGDLFCFGHIQW